MKIGILTHFHNSTNYGGVLQAYALCKCLNNAGHCAKQILYKHSLTGVGTPRMTCKAFFKKASEHIKRRIYKKRNRSIRRIKEEAFVEFRDSIPHTSEEYTLHTIDHVVKEFDAFITGSDQVWNPLWYDPSYMLNFVGDAAPKLSYAASIGLGSLTAQQEQIFCEHINTFAGISVRERTAKDLLSSLTDKDVRVCVDPTLLLSGDDWDEVASERVVDGEYVFLYLLGDDIKTRKLAEKFAKFHNKKLVTIPDLLGTYRKNDRKIHSDIIENATPENFISLIKYADYILTDSFHACVFSLLYKKQFFAFSRSGYIKTGSRIADLMNLFECKERFCKDKSKLDCILSLEPLDYTKDFDLFNREKQASLDYLTDHLNYLKQEV